MTTAVNPALRNHIIGAIEGISAVADGPNHRLGVHTTQVEVMAGVRGPGIENGIQTIHRFMLYETPPAIIRVIAYLFECICCCCCRSEMPELERAFIDVTRDLEGYLHLLIYAEGDDTAAQELLDLQRQKFRIEELLRVARKLHARGKIHWNPADADLSSTLAFLAEKHKIELNDSKCSHIAYLNDDAAATQYTCRILTNEDSENQEMATELANARALLKDGEKTGRELYVANGREGAVEVRVGTLDSTKIEPNAVAAFPLQPGADKVDIEVTPVT